jgi:hypothetical protein
VRGMVLWELPIADFQLAIVNRQSAIGNDS